MRPEYLNLSWRWQTQFSQTHTRIMYTTMLLFLVIFIHRLPSRDIAFYHIFVFHDQINKRRYYTGCLVNHAHHHTILLIILFFQFWFVAFLSTFSIMVELWNCSCCTYQSSHMNQFKFFFYPLKTYTYSISQFII